jgi:hypothetical protein
MTSDHSPESGLRPRTRSHGSSATISNEPASHPKLGSNGQSKTPGNAMLRSAYLPEPETDSYCSFDERREALYIVHYVQELAPLVRYLLLGYPLVQLDINLVFAD